VAVVCACWCDHDRCLFQTELRKTFSPSDSSVAPWDSAMRKQAAVNPSLQKHSSCTTRRSGPTPPPFEASATRHCASRRCHNILSTRKSSTRSRLVRPPASTTLMVPSLSIPSSRNGQSTVRLDHLIMVLTQLTTLEQHEARLVASHAVRRKSRCGLCAISVAIGGY